MRAAKKRHKLYFKGGLIAAPLTPARIFKKGNLRDLRKERATPSLKELPNYLCGHRLPSLYRKKHYNR